MPKPYPQEFRDNVVHVAQNREDGVTLEQIAADFGIHPMTLNKWIRKAKRRVRLFEPENEVLRRRPSVTKTGKKHRGQQHRGTLNEEQNAPPDRVPLDKQERLRRKPLSSGIPIRSHLDDHIPTVMHHLRSPADLNILTTRQSDLS